jgi:hypothetical protein
VWNEGEEEDEEKKKQKEKRKENNIKCKVMITQLIHVK